MRRGNIEPPAPVESPDRATSPTVRGSDPASRPASLGSEPHPVRCTVPKPWLRRRGSGRPSMKLLSHLLGSARRVRPQSLRYEHRHLPGHPQTGRGPLQRWRVHRGRVPRRCHVELEQQQHRQHQWCGWWSKRRQQRSVDLEQQLERYGCGSEHGRRKRGRHWRQRFGDPVPWRRLRDRLRTRPRWSMARALADDAAETTKEPRTGTARQVTAPSLASRASAPAELLDQVEGLEAGDEATLPACAVDVEYRQ